MTNVTKITAVLALGLGFGTAALAQDDAANLEPGEVTGVTCDDFFMADAAGQEELARALGVEQAEEVELDSETSARVHESIDNSVRAVGLACNGNEEMLLTDVEVMSDM